MQGNFSSDWKNKVVSPEDVLSKIKPGMSIFLGTGEAEPRTLVKHLISSDQDNLCDLELIQLVSLGSTIPINEYYPQKYRLKTFFPGWVVSEAIDAGRVDLIPSCFSRIPQLIESGGIQIDVAFIQITPPDEAGYSSLGVSIDVAKNAIEKASLVVGEINKQIPYTLGDTFVHIDDFDYFVYATDPPICFPRSPVDDVFDKVASNVASIVENNSCICFFLGPLFESLGQHLAHKKNLSVHSPFFTDPLMDLVRSGAVTNKYKGCFRGKSLTAYAHGTRELMRWLDRNPLIEFQGIDVVADPRNIGINDKFTVIMPTRKVDLTSGVALHVGKGSIAEGPGEAQEFVAGATLSRGGRTICALPSRNLKEESNILLSIKDYPNHFFKRESIDFIVTEYGIATLTGRTVRERALALIDIAHPDYRAKLVKQAKEANILYPDQIYIPEMGNLYPENIACIHTFKTGLTVHFRAIKPSDEEGMRKLFYRFSDEAVYYRYFSRIKAMPHARMQEYVNVDYRCVMSIVGFVEIDPGIEHIIAEARYVCTEDSPFADIAIIVDEKYQRKGIASFLFNMLIRLARERGIEGFQADVLHDNKPVMNLLKKHPIPTRIEMMGTSLRLILPLLENSATGEN